MGHRRARLRALLVNLMVAGCSLAMTLAAIEAGARYRARRLAGDVGSVRAAVDAGATAASKVGDLVSAHLIARPEHSLLDNFV